MFLGDCTDKRCSCVKQKLECSCGCSEFCENSDRNSPRGNESDDDDLEDEVSGDEGYVRKSKPSYILESVHHQL